MKPCGSSPSPPGKAVTGSSAGVCWGRAHSSGALEWAARKSNWPRLPHLDVEGPGACYDFEEVVPHQEVTGNSENSHHAGVTVDEKKSIYPQL